MITLTCEDKLGRELTVEIDYSFVVPDSAAGPCADPSIENVTVVAIDGRSILGPKEDGYGSREMAYESERFEKMLLETPDLLAKVKECCLEREWDQRYGDDYERGAE